MRTGTKYFIAIASLTVLCACARKQTNYIEKTEWLIGTWENKTDNGSIYETWDKTNENEFSGKGYIIKEQDTIIFENIRLVQERGGLFYVPTVNDQNDGSPVQFIAKTISETGLTFENLEHDFPQTISYFKISSDSIVAEISGTKNGQESKETFSMNRLK